MNRHTIQELYQWQALPLNIKIRMTKRRIRDWVDEYGEDGVYVSFSGGKDSTVLLHIAREMYPNIKACFVDTGLEYPEIRKFVKTFDNVDIVKPKMGFKQVVEKYGFPFISKEVSECVSGARKYLKSILTEMQEKETVLTDRQTDAPYRYYYDRVTGQGKYKKPTESTCQNLVAWGGYDNKCRKLRGIGEFAKQRQGERADCQNSDVIRDADKGKRDKGEYP